MGTWNLLLGNQQKQASPELSWTSCPHFKNQSLSQQKKPWISRMPCKVWQFMISIGKDFIVAGRSKRVLAWSRENFWDCVKLTVGCFKELFQTYCERYGHGTKERKEWQCIGMEWVCKNDGGNSYTFIYSYIFMFMLYISFGLSSVPQSLHIRQTVKNILTSNPSLWSHWIWLSVFFWNPRTLLLRIDMLLSP